MSAVLPVDPVRAREPDVSLVDQCRGLQRVVCAFAHHVEVGQAVKLPVDQGDELFEGLLVSAAPGLKQL